MHLPIGVLRYSSVTLIYNIVLLFFLVGFRNTKAGAIIQVSNEEEQRKLPQHDFPITELCQTPSSFRVMTWKTEIIGGMWNILQLQYCPLFMFKGKHDHK